MMLGLFFIVLIIVAIYTASLAAALATQLEPYPLTTLSDLSNNPNIFFGVHN